MTSTEGDQRSLWWSWREAEKRSEGGQAACEPAAGLCSGDGGCHQDVMEGPASESRAPFATHMYVGATDAQVCCCTLHDVERKTPTALRTDSKRRQKPLCVLEKVEQRCWHSTKPFPPQTLPTPECATCLCSHSHHRAGLCLGAGGLARVSGCCHECAGLAQLAARHAVQPRGLYFGHWSTNPDVAVSLAHPVSGSGLVSRGPLSRQALSFQPLYN